MPIDWYEQVSPDEPITQGDLIFDCPVVSWKEAEPELSGTDYGEVLKAHTMAVALDAIVMTQACDLKQEKVQNVILCPHFSISAHRQAWETDMRERDQNPTEKAWCRYAADICDGFIWNLTMLTASEVEGLTTDHRIVDFHEVYSVPRRFIESFLAQRAQARLRLCPPYREHLSQAFARFFMRVGLPVPVALEQ